MGIEKGGPGPPLFLAIAEQAWPFTAGVIFAIIHI